MSITIEVAEANYAEAEEALKDWMKRKHGPAWENHIGEYYYDMPSSLGRTFYRSFYNAEVALNAARLTGDRKSLHTEITTKAAELLALFEQVNADKTRTLWIPELNATVISVTRELTERI